MEQLSLNGKWNMHLDSANTDYEVEVPVSDYNAMLKIGAIPDPFYKNNELNCLFVSETDKYFEREFTVCENPLAYNNVILSCKMLDTLAKIYINDKPAGEGRNTYVGYEFDIKCFLKQGRNKIRIYFESPVNYVKKCQKEEPLPRNGNGINGVPYIRKPACHFGWDWGINLPLSGIIKDISVLFFNEEIRDFDVCQTHIDGKVVLDVSLPENIVSNVQGRVISPDGEMLDLNFVNGRASITIENPKLWWIRELSGTEMQPLYEIIVGEARKKIGLRTIELNRKTDEYGSNFQFVLNGIPVFAKGANLIPPDAVIDRFGEKKLKKLIDDALSANMNMIRVWGGGYYGSDAFYNMCDEKGILVWQDFMFACLMYPFYRSDFLENVKEEVKYNVLRIKHHPSLALWCGNNEIEFMFAHLPENMKIVQWYKKFFYEILPSELRKYDKATSYIETSPIGRSFRKRVTADSDGDTHMWHVWHGSKNLKYYRKRFTRFCSEYGMESLPSMDCIAEFADADEYDLYSKTMLFHQKCLSGNSKMKFYLLERYDEPKFFDDLIYFTGLTQMECIRDATEHWRRNKGRCNGSLWWQYNDCWGAPSWSSVDYSGKWKPLMYASREFNAPFTVSFADNRNTADIYVLNDTLNEYDYTLEYGICNFDGKELFSNTVKGVSAANTANKAADFSLKPIDKGNAFAFARLYCNDKLVAERTKVFLPERKLKLKKANIKAEVINNQIILESDTYAHQVYADLKGVNIPLSENCFDLIPNKKKIIHLTQDAVINPDMLTVKCVNNIECNKSALGRFLFRLKFNLKPENFANRIYYSVS